MSVTSGPRHSLPRVVPRLRGEGGEFILWHPSCRGGTIAGEYFPLMLDPAPYRSVAVASTFSPRFEQVLAEAKRIRDRFDSELCLVYVGEKSEETSAKFAAALDRISLPKNSPIHYEQGDPATAILRAIERHDIDLIVAGALEKEVVLHPFLGNVARRLLREGR